MTSALQALSRGNRGTCPHCGVGSLFRKRWKLSLHDSCSSCKLRYLLNQGDLWIYLLFVDRGAFILPLVAALYFRDYWSNWPLFFGFGLTMVALLVVTTPNRYGICVALNYLSRVHFGNVDDSMPDLSEGKDET